MKCLIAAHDAGGAELVTSWARRHPEVAASFLVGGPAESILARKFQTSAQVTAEDLERAVAASDLVLTGTSASSRLETDAIACAKRLGIPSAAFLDYWWDFEKRFLRDGARILPDEIWVADEYAFALARTDFPGHPIIDKGNPYLLDVADEGGKYPRRAGGGEVEILYLSQPYHEAYADEQGVSTLINDIESLRAFLKTVRDQYPPGLVLPRVRIRPHPTETAEKYRPLIAEFQDLRLSLSPYKDLVEDCARSDWAVGMYTMALVVALALGLQVFYYLPLGARPFVLPYREIRDFNPFIRSLR